MSGRRVGRPPFAPPFLKAGKLIIAQTANILLYLGPRLALAPRDEAAQLWANQLQLTITDLVVEIHDTHHPITTYLYYEEQRPAAKRRTADFWRYRVPKILGYFEHVKTPQAIEHVGPISSAAGFVTWTSPCSRSSRGCATPSPSG